MSVIGTHILALICLISVQFTRAFELPILHPKCDEYEDGINPTQLPYPNDCNKFYKCSGGYAFTLNCPEGLHWSVKQNRCEYPEIANCKINNNENLKKTTTKSPSGNTQDEIMILECPIGNDPNEIIHLPYPGDCTKYFKCEIGRAYPMRCENELHWSVVLNSCALPVVAKCFQTPRNSSSTTSSSTTSTSTTSSSTTTSPTVTTTTETTLKTSTTTVKIRALTIQTTPTIVPIYLSISKLNSMCQKVNLGFLSHPGNCRRYIQCTNGMGRIFSCPGGLYFNTKIGACHRYCVW